MFKKEVTAQIEITVTPELAAEAFAEFSEVEQAKFFETIAEEIKNWPDKVKSKKTPIALFKKQMQFAAGKTRTTEALRVMREIGHIAQRELISRRPK